MDALAPIRTSPVGVLATGILLAVAIARARAWLWSWVWVRIELGFLIAFGSWSFLRVAQAVWGLDEQELARRVASGAVRVEGPYVRR